MPGANSPIQTVRLAATSAPFAILGRFPAGFERLAHGGYTVAEEFVILDGSLRLDGQWLKKRTLVHVGAGRLRQELVSPKGCLVLAWFEGPPEFLPEEQLTAPAGRLHVFDTRDLQGGVQTDVAQWSAGRVDAWPINADGFDGVSWAASRADWTGRPDASVIWRERFAEWRSPHV